jgi:hypothetical protein
MFLAIFIFAWQFPNVCSKKSPAQFLNVVTGIPPSIKLPTLHVNDHKALALLSTELNPHIDFNSCKLGQQILKLNRNELCS